MLSTSISDMRSVVDKKVCAPEGSADLVSSSSSICFNRSCIARACRACASTPSCQESSIRPSLRWHFPFSFSSSPPNVNTSVAAYEQVLSDPLPLFTISPSPQLSQYLLFSPLFSPAHRVVRVSKRADLEPPPTIQPYSHVAEGIGGGDFWVAAECRVFTHSVAGGS